MCNGNCLTCGKCNRFQILDYFAFDNKETHSCNDEENKKNDNRTTHEPRDGFGIAIDIGTTTVVIALLDLTSGEMLGRHSFLNPQCEFGPDVISRIDAANKGHLEYLNRLIKDNLIAAIAELLRHKEISSNQMTQIAIAGNTTMSYLLLGLPCESLGVKPFKPAFTIPEIYSLAGCNAFIFPYLAAFIGGDISAGLLYIISQKSLLQKSLKFLLVDLGTNGEMGLYNNGELIVTATAAGPAFDTIGSGGASHVISLLADMIRRDEIDESGAVSQPDTVLTQAQIRELQLAKSAIRAGLEILIEDSGLTYTDLDALYLAGGIGQAINIADACAIGLIPDALESKSAPIGNASLGGAVSFLLAPMAQHKKLAEIIHDAKEINLATHKKFSDYYMDYMFFEV